MAGMDHEKASVQKKVGPIRSASQAPMTVPTDLPHVEVTKRVKGAAGGRRQEHVQAIMVRPGDMILRKVDKKPTVLKVLTVDRTPSKMVITTARRKFRLSPATVVTVFR